MRCVSDSEWRRLMCRSFVMRIMKAMATGMAMVKKVHVIHAVLWIVRNRVSGRKYRGTGTARDTTAMRDTVRGKPSDCGHLPGFERV